MAASGTDPARLRSVHLIAESATFKALYLDRDRMALRPNAVFVDAAGQVVFETNEVGLKGDPIDPSRKLAVVWGDSVVFGSGRSWPCLLDALAPGWQFLNGGIDGDPYTNILRRSVAFNRQHKVARNLLMLGWHPFLPERIVQRPPGRWSRLTGNGAAVEIKLDRGGNGGLRHDLTAFLQQVPNTVVLTMPTALNHRIADQDLSAYLVDGDDETLFRFIGYVPYQVAGQRQGFEHIIERNAITREVCTALGVRLIDLFAMFDTTGLPDFREHFFDILHLRPRSYPLLAQRIHDSIKDLLA